MIAPQFRQLGIVAASLCLLLLGPSMVRTAPLTVEWRGSFTLPTTAVDQHGASFPVSGLSGITYRGGSRFTAVMDNSNKLVELDVQLAANGTIASATFVGGLTLADARDFEGIAYTNAGRGSIWLADEGAPELREYDLQTGSLRQTIAAPAAFSQRRSGFGWESLVRRPGGAELWTANEEALVVDGGLSSPSQGTVVRLVRHVAAGNSFTPAEQFAYNVEPWHGGDSPATTAERSGLVDLVVLADGTLLALERSLAVAGPSPPFQNRIYQLDLAGATNIAALPSLVGQSYVAVTKQLLWSGTGAGLFGMNMEGLTLGPRLPNGHATLIGTVDDGGTSDPLSTNTLVAFEVTSPLGPPSIPGDVNFDGMANAADLARLVETYGSPSEAVWEDGDFDGDGKVGLRDLAALAAEFSRGGPAVSQRGLMANPVPEPGGFCLLVLTLGAWVCCTRCRNFLRRKSRFSKHLDIKGG